MKKYLQKQVDSFDEVKKYNGELITIFHNDTMGTAQDWIDWKYVYEEIVKLSIAK